jgi:hypothetical protein
MSSHNTWQGHWSIFKFSDLHDSDISDGGFEGCDIVQTCEVDTNILDAHVLIFRLMSALKMQVLRMFCNKGKAFGS